MKNENFVESSSYFKDFSKLCYYVFQYSLMQFCGQFIYKMDKH